MSNKDYCSPILCLGAKQRTPSSVAFYDSPGKVWAVCIFLVPVHTRGNNELRGEELIKDGGGCWEFKDRV